MRDWRAMTKTMVCWIAVAVWSSRRAKRKMRLHAAEILKVNAVRGHMGYGRIAEQEKDYASAEKEFLLGITARPDSEVAYSAAGGFYRRRERWAKAIAMYRKQLAAMPKDPSLTRLSNAHYSLALSLQGSGRPDRPNPSSKQRWPPIRITQMRRRRWRRCRERRMKVLDCLWRRRGRETYFLV